MVLKGGGWFTHLLLSHVSAFLHVFKLLVGSFSIYLADARDISFCFRSLLTSWSECCSVFPVERASTVSWRTGTASRGSSHFSLFLAAQWIQLCLLFPLPLGSLPLIVYMSTILRLSKERQRKKGSVGSSVTWKDSSKQGRRGAGEQSCPSEHLKLLAGLSSAALPISKLCWSRRPAVDSVNRTNTHPLSSWIPPVVFIPSLRRASSGSYNLLVVKRQDLFTIYAFIIIH